MICVESGRRAGGKGCEGDLRLRLGVVVGESKVDSNLGFVVHNAGDVVIVVVGGDIVVDVSFPLDGGPRDSPSFPVGDGFEKGFD